MRSFKTYIKEDSEVLLEKLITFGGKAYPKFGNVVILAGGAGSGKGFVQDTLFGIEGKKFDVDELKKLAAQSSTIQKKVKSQFGVDILDLSKRLNDPENTSKLHMIIGDALSLPNKSQQAFFASVMTASSERKPNIIFDVTLKDMRKLANLTQQVQAIGYEKKNIHIVWVVNDVEVAKKQNLDPKRGRVVPQEILINTHKGASHTMQDIVKMGSGINRYMDGDIVFAFNKIGVDSEIVKSGKGGQYVVDANYFYLKRAGKSIIPAKQLDVDMLTKIKSYVPKNVDWINI